jgi:hypothetical protein
MMLGGKKCDSGNYESQLIKFPSLKQVLDETIDYIKEEQNNLVNKANQLGIKTESICITQDLNGEFFASVTEVVLEGLRWIQPPLLDKKDNNRYELV